MWIAADEKKKKTVFGQGRPEGPKDTARMFLWRHVPPLMTFCGQWKTTWQHLTEINHGQLHTFIPTKHETRVCAYGWYCILCEDWLWSGEYGSVELEAICCLLLRAAGQQSAMLIDHLFNVQNETNTFRAAHTSHQLTKCNSLLSSKQFI